MIGSLTDSDIWRITQHPVIVIAIIRAIDYVRKYILEVIKKVCKWLYNKFKNISRWILRKVVY